MSFPVNRMLKAHDVATLMVGTVPRAFADLQHESRGALSAAGINVTSSSSFSVL